MGLLDGKRLLVTGVITDASIAFSVARVALEQGATVVLTGFGRLSLVERIAKKLPGPAPVVELDVTNAERPGRAARPGPRARRRHRRRAALDRVRAGVRARRRLPGDAVGRRGHRGARLDVLAAGAGHGGAAAAAGARRLDRRAHLRRHRGLAGVRLDGRGQGRAGVGRPVPRPRARPARHPGQPGRRPARCARWRPGRIPGFSRFEDVWDERAPLGWDLTDPEPVARTCVALLSDWFPATTGEIVHVDGGFHATGV